MLTRLTICTVKRGYVLELTRMRGSGAVNGQVVPDPAEPGVSRADGRRHDGMSANIGYPTCVTAATPDVGFR